jgi:integrase
LRSWGRVQHDAFAAVVLPRIQPAHVRCFSLEEIQRILTAAEDPYKAFFWLAAETGLRAGELCALRWEDADLALGVLRVRQSLSRGIVSPTKTPAGRREVVLSLALTAALHSLGPGEPAALIFHAGNGEPWIADDIVKRHLKPLLKKLEMEVGGLHAFRHFHSTMMDRLNAPMAVRKARLGHASLAVTDRYTHLASEDERRVVEEISERIVTRSCDQKKPAVM